MKNNIKETRKAKAQEIYTGRNIKKICKTIRRKYMMKNKKSNKLKRSINGNINTYDNKIKIIQWNKGSSDILNMLQEIKDIIKIQKPEVFIINELNLEDDINIESINIKGYSLEIDQLMEKSGISRTGMYIKNNLNYTREKGTKTLMNLILL